MEAAGNIDRLLNEEESRAVAKAGLALMKSLGDYPREVTTYALAFVVTAMAPSDFTAQMDIVDAVRDLQGIGG